MSLAIENGFSEEYNWEIQSTADYARTLFEAHGVTEVSFGKQGTDDLTGLPAEIVGKVIKVVAEQDGYELSYWQLCSGVYRAANAMGIFTPKEATE